MIAAVVIVGSPRAYVAALLATSFRTASADEASDVRALHETALATVERARMTMDGVAADVGEGLPYVKLCDVGLCAGRARFHRPTCARAA